MKINKVIWALPFISFIFGYTLINYIFPANEIMVPKLIGKHILEASQLLSDINLNLRILNQKEESDIPEGIILDQNPITQKIKINKPVYVVLSKKVNKTLMPDLRGKALSEIEQINQKLGIKSKIYFIESSTKENCCVCQYPKANNPLEKNEKAILYVSSGSKKLILVPDFRGLQFEEVKNFLDLQEIKPMIALKNQSVFDPQKNYIVVEQRPLPGSLTQLNKSTNIQLYIQESEIV